jgi:hypothetical protein
VTLTGRKDAVPAETGGLIVAGRDAYTAGGDLTVNNFYRAADAEVQDLDVISAPLVVGDVPQQPQGFQPRAGLLSRLEAPGPPGVSVGVVTGIRGGGKTQLAAAVAREKLALGWRLVAWVDAESADSLAAGLANVADAAGLPVRDGEAGLAVRHWLEADGARCLLVFDNAADIDGLRPFVPVGGAAHVLITSSNTVSSVLGTTVPVGVFEMGEALAFLAARTGLADEVGARELAEELGCLPLGLAQAAGLIAVQRLTYGVYLGRLRSTPVSDYLGRVRGDAYPYRLAEAIGLSLESVDAADPAGGSAVVMGMVALLSEGGMSRRVLHAAASAGKGGISAAAMDEALGRLAEASLAGFSEDGSAVSAHRLVMRVVREWLIADGLLPVVASAAVFVLRRFADALGEAWRDPAGVRELAVHSAALSGHLAQHLAAVGTQTSAELMDVRLQSLFLLMNLGDSAAQAVTTGERLVADSEMLYGHGHPSTLTARNNLALAYQHAGQLPRAIALMEGSLGDNVRVSGPDSRRTLTLSSNLGLAYKAAGRLQDAIAAFERAATGFAATEGIDHPDTISAVNNVALAYKDAGRTGEALPLMEAVAAARERIQGPAASRYADRKEQSRPPPPRIRRPGGRCDPDHGRHPHRTGASSGPGPPVDPDGPQQSCSRVQLRRPGRQSDPAV